MKRLLLILLFNLASLLTGCASMHFDLEEATEDYDYGEWHHVSFLSLATLSPIVDLKERCEGRKAKSVRIDSTLSQFVVYVATSTLYEPWRVSYECRKN